MADVNTRVSNPIPYTWVAMQGFSTTLKPADPPALYKCKYRHGANINRVQIKRHRLRSRNILLQWHWQCIAYLYPGGKEGINACTYRFCKICYCDGVASLSEMNIQKNIYRIFPDNIDWIDILNGHVSCTVSCAGSHSISSSWYKLDRYSASLKKFKSKWVRETN